MTNIKDLMLDGIADVTVVGGGWRRGPLERTVVSVVNGGEHFNVYPSDTLWKVMQTWQHGARVRFGSKDGKPLIVEAGGTTSLRKKRGQRPHLAVTTARIGKLDGTAKGLEVESWIEDDKAYVRIGGFYRNNGEQQ